MPNSSEPRGPEPRSTEPGEFYVSVGVGPHAEPWPTSSDFDPELLAHGDRRNIIDEYRYLTVEAIRARLSDHRSSVHVAIENWQHDLNIGALVRTANAFNVAGVHIVGKKHWNQHGALMTDKYLDVFHHATVSDFADFCGTHQLEIVAFENTENATALDNFRFPEATVMLFGNEGIGLTAEAIAAAHHTVAITQYGSVRSLNASAAGAIALFAWAQQHRPSA